MRRPALLLALLAPVWLGEARAQFRPPTPLPETLRGTVQVPVPNGQAGKAPAPINTLHDLFPALAACWQAPEGLAKFERTEITARFSLRRDGSVIGSPRITFSAVPGDGRAKALLTEAALSAIRRCTPLAITPGLGGAIAGRPLALRFIYEGPKGQGV